jgi:nucleotide-binding universal stress UspA family protein
LADRRDAFLALFLVAFFTQQFSYFSISFSTVMLSTNAIILAPTDFSECAHHALEYATSLAKSFHGTVHLVHVIEPIEKTDQWSYVYTSMEQIRPLVEKEVTTKLEALAEELRSAGAEVKTHVLHGTGYVQLANLAESLKADAIVIGTSGKRGLEHIILGSTTERLLRMAICPILSVPPKK